jgi:CheY-like chemotaxis protein
VVLCVEDDPDTFKLASLRLRAKYHLVWAQNDREAVELLRRFGAGLHAVVMDIELKGSTLDGLDLVRLLRGRPTHRAAPDFARGLPPLPLVPVVVLTAYTGRYSEADALACGATSFATKPIDFTRLNLALAKGNISAVMARLQQGSRTTEVKPHANPPGPRSTPSRS